MSRRRRQLTALLALSAVVPVGIVALVLVGAAGSAAGSRTRVPSGLSGCGAAPGQVPDLEPAQERNAATIVDVAVARGLGVQGATIGVAVAWAESSLLNYANDGTSTLVGRAEGRQLTDAERAVARESLTFVHDRVGNNLDSIGLFQQRPMTGWGAPAELIDPATSAGLFFDRLELVPGWSALPPWNAAQLVQGSPSSDGGIYRDAYQRAVAIVADLTGPDLELLPVCPGWLTSGACLRLRPLRSARDPPMAGRRRGVDTRTVRSRPPRSARFRAGRRCCWSAPRRPRSTG